jgi:ketosteroid isomerase-like protein
LRLAELWLSFWLVRCMDLFLESTMKEELLKLEQEFAQAVANNDADAIDGFLADDWIIVEPDGGIIDKARFLEVIKSGALSHETMQSDDIGVRLYGNTAVVTGLTTSKGKFMGQDFTSHERATSIGLILTGSPNTGGHPSGMFSGLPQYPSPGRIGWPA